MRRVWALGDLHLSFAAPKPMDIFGAVWKDHPERIAENCRKLIEPNDLLLIPGDLSWAMKRAEAERDLEYIAALPGIKVLCKGNHDYWWDSDKPLKFDGLNDTPYISADGTVGVAGTRGWPPLYGPLTDQERASGEKNIAKEIRRLEKRLDAIKECRFKFAMIHHPPLPEFVPLLRKYAVDAIVYGHVHLSGKEETLPETWHGMKCICVAADRIRFMPRLIATLDPA